MKKSFAFVLVALSCAGTALCADKMTVAVSDFLPQGLEASSVSIITDRLRNEMFNSGRFIVLERGQMESILKEQGFQKSGCTSDECAVEIGQLLGVQFLVVGSIGKLGQTYTINARMIDITTGKIIQTANTDCRCEIDLLLSKSTVEIAGRFARGIGGGAEPPPAAQAPATAPPPDTIASSKPAAAPGPGKDPAVKPAKKSVMWPKVAFGVLAVGSGIAAVMMNNQAQADINTAEGIQSDYTGGGSNVDYAASSTEYKAAIKSAGDRMLLRNVFYGVAGLAVVGFAVTLAF